MHLHTHSACLTCSTCRTSSQQASKVTKKNNNNLLTIPNLQFSTISASHRTRTSPYMETPPHLATQRLRLSSTGDILPLIPSPASQSCHPSSTCHEYIRTDWAGTVGWRTRWTLAGLYHRRQQVPNRDWRDLQLKAFEKTAAGGVVWHWVADMLISIQSRSLQPCIREGVGIFSPAGTKPWIDV